MSATKAQMKAALEYWYCGTGDEVVYRSIMALIDRYGDGMTVTMLQIDEWLNPFLGLYPENDAGKKGDHLLSILADLGITVVGGEEKK